MPKKVSLFTTFFEADSGYSLITVAETQIRMMLDHGYEPIVLVDQRFKSDKALWQPHSIDVRPVIPPLGAPVNSILVALREHLAGVDVCITHDIVLLNDYRARDLAMREYAKTRDDLLWLHFIHSCPSGQRDGTNLPGYLIYPNASDKPRVCQVYGLAGQEHRVVPCRAAHSIDPLSVWSYDPLTRSLIGKFNLLDAEVSAVYPVRLDRGKQVEKVIRLLAGVKRAGYAVKLLVIDWQSAGSHFQKYIDELIELAWMLGVGNDVAFTSRLDDRCSQGVPRHVVTELMDLSNLYIHASRVETYSLVVHEAILRGKLVVLNHDFPALRELFGETAIYVDFGSDRFERTYSPDVQSFFDSEAHRLIAELRQNRALMAQTKARREWTPERLWPELESLFYLKPSPKGT